MDEIEIVKPAKYIPKYRAECNRCGVVFDVPLDHFRNTGKYTRCPSCQNYIEDKEFKLVKIKIKKGKQK